eukprot:COSAG01_NODE_84_length_27672_cov_60.966344_20_plen_123_part_00
MLFRIGYTRFGTCRERARESRSRTRRKGRGSGVGSRGEEAGIQGLPHEKLTLPQSAFGHAQSPSFMKAGGGGPRPPPPRPRPRPLPRPAPPSENSGGGSSPMPGVALGLKPCCPNPLPIPGL